MGLTPLVHRGSVTLPTELRTPPSLTLHIPPSQHLTFPLADDERVAAVAQAACHNTGLISTYLVLTTKKTLTVGKLDVETSTYKTTGRITIPGECVDCWIADGPTVVARYTSKVVVLECAKWKAQMVEEAFQSVFVAGEQVLCVSSAASELVRHAELRSFPLPLAATPLALYAPTLAKVTLPPNFDPHLITCVAQVRPGLALPYKRIYGTSEGRLMCCSRERVVLELALEDPPLSVTVAEAAGGVAVLVVTLGGMDRRVITLFADSLRRINSWSGVHQVVVADLANVGHDQMLLITHPTSPFTHISLLESSPETTNAHKTEILNSITEALQIRLQDGVQELQAAERRRAHKMHMLTAACNLMQGIGNLTLSEAELESSIVLQATHMGRRFLVLSVKLAKKDQTLFATSLQGFVKSAASYLPSSEVNSQRFLLSFPLKECRFPLHIVLAAEGGFTQWIHSVDAPQTTDVAAVSETSSEICEKFMSVMGGAHSKGFLDALVRAVALHTDAIKEEDGKGSRTSMYARDASVVSEVFSESGEVLGKLCGARVVEMVIWLGEVMLEEVQSDGVDKSLVELHGTTDRCFGHLMSSIMYNSFGFF